MRIMKGGAQTGIDRIGGILIVMVLIIIALIGWYAVMRIKEEEKNTLAVQIAPLRIFSTKNQIIPEGATSLEVDQSLAAFGFAKPLPFFDKNNVVQSLDIRTPDIADASTSRKSAINTSVSTGVYLSYRIPGQSKTIIRDAYIDYFQSMGLENVIESQQKETFAFVLPHTPPVLLKISFFEQPFEVAEGQELITAVLSITPIMTDTQQ